MINLFPVDNIHKSVDEALINQIHGDTRQGPVVEAFERKLGGWIGFPNILTTCSGTTALQLALRAEKIGYVNGGSKDDQVIVTPMTCAATIMPIIAAGAIPVWVDIYPETGLLNPHSAASLIEAKTRAILCVDWGGTPCDMKALEAIGDQFRIAIIEDAAHGLGSINWNGNKIGNQSADYTVFSFQALKHMSCGDGGALSVSDIDDYKLAKLARWYGIDREGKHKDSRHEEDIEVWGLKWHMNDINALIGTKQLDYIDDTLIAHRHNANIYWSNLDRERFTPAFPESALAEGSFWLYTMLLRDKEDRLNFIKHMTEKGIRASQIHTRNDRHTVFAEFANNVPLSGVDKFSERMVCIPVHGKLTNSEIWYIVEACSEYARDN